MNEIVWAKRGDDAAVVDHIERALSQGGTLALPGDAASGAIVRSLADRPLDWTKVAVTLTDDCEVAADHPASGFGRLEEILGSSGATLARFAPVWDGFRFRLVWVDVGEDGRVASILTGLAIDEEAPPTLVRVRSRGPGPDSRFGRVTLNHAGLLSCEELILVLRSAAQRALVEAAAAGESDLPVGRLLRKAPGPVTAFWSEGGRGAE